MRLLKTKNPDDVAKIYPWLIPTKTETRMNIASELYGRLKEKPDDTFVLVAIERGITRCIVVAYMSSKRVCWLWQSQAEPGFKHSRLMMDALKSWARGKGAKKIGIGVPDERKKAVVRRWGFKELRNGELRLKLK
jgi:hypothetical protein